VQIQADGNEMEKLLAVDDTDSYRMRRSALFYLIPNTSSYCYKNKTRQYSRERWPLSSKSHEFAVSPSFMYIQRQLIVQRCCNRNVNTKAPHGQSLICSGYLLPAFGPSASPLYAERPSAISCLSATALRNSEQWTTALSLTFNWRLYWHTQSSTVPLRSHQPTKHNISRSTCYRQHFLAHRTKIS